MKILKLATFILSLSMCVVAAGGCGAQKTRYTAEIVVKNYGTITVTLDRSQAPITVDHFIKLAKSGAYDGSSFIRMQKNFVLQGGAGAKDNSTIKGEFTENGVNNQILHKQGVLSMARSEDMNSASSQFFIVLATSDTVSYSLDGKYAAFGEITDGWEVVEAICNDITPDKYIQNYYYSSMGFLAEENYITIETVNILD